MNLRPRTPIRKSADWSVWRGEQAGTRQLFLVKEADPKSPYSTQLAARLHDEYRFLATLDHPHLLKPVWMDKSGLWAAFSDAQCHLAQYIAAHGPIQPTLVANILAAVADALDYLHGRRLGHGCVNTHSLFVGPAGEVAFGDFLGYPFNTTGALPVPDPDPRYQAPEMIDATLGKPGPSADLYCLGFTALELLAGDKFEQLFGVPDGANWLAWHADPYKQLADWQPVLGHAPAGLLEIIAGLIAKRPADRAFPNAAHLKTTLLRSGLTSDLRLPPYRPSDGTAPTGKVITILRPPLRQRTGRLPSRTDVKPVLTLTPVDSSAPAKTFAPAVPVLLGRDPECTATVTGDGVSRKHALLTCGPDGVWRVFNLNTPAGTYLNGNPVGRSKVYPDDELYLGSCGFRVTLDYRPAGRTFDQFRLISQLNSGRRGRVYRATWATKGGRSVAVRLFPKDFQYDAAGLRRLLRGVPEAARVRNRHLVRAYRGGSERFGPDRVWFLAMEYMSGGSLRDRLKSNGPLPVADALRAAREAATGAAALAEIGWVHRNINPGCVLFGADGGAKLGDFFFARQGLDPANRDGTMTGDPDFAPDAAYQAPECVTGEPRLSPACDVYSLGATLYESLTGRPPIDPTGTPNDLSRRVMSAVVVPPRELNPGVPRAVSDVICRALAKDPGGRFTTPTELAHALYRLEIEFAPAE